MIRVASMFMKHLHTRQGQLNHSFCRTRAWLNARNTAGHVLLWLGSNSATLPAEDNMSGAHSLGSSGVKSAICCEYLRCR